MGIRTASVPEDQRQTALDRALPVLKHLARYPRGINLDALAFQLEIPKSTLHRALAALARVGFVEQDERGDYRLGTEFLRVAFEFHDARDVRALVQPVLESLAATIGESAVFARLDGSEVVYLASATPAADAIQVATKVGARVPAHTTAVGKVLITFGLDRPDGFDAWIRGNGGLIPRTPASVVTVDGLRDEIEKARARGYAVEHQESEPGVDGIAFPVYLDNPRRPTGAIGLLAIAARTSATELIARADEIKDVIEGGLGPVTEETAGSAGDQRVRVGDVTPLPPATASGGSKLASTRQRSRRDHGERIESVESVMVDAGRCNYVFVIVRTHDGEVGVGEATLEWNEQSVVATVAQMGRVIAGMNSNRIEHIWQTLYRGGFWRGGPVLMSAIAGIEQALWDLKGKRLGAPVYELLGGACRDHIPLYGNGPRGSSPDEFARSAHAIVERGFRALKFAAVDATLAVDTSHTIVRAAAIVGAVREAVGPDIAIAVDVHGRLSPAMSLRLADAIEPFDIWFLEEPALPGDPLGLANVRQGTRIPVAAGERLFERGEFRDLFERRAVALVQPDIAHCGGIAEARRIAAMAETYQIGFAPHNPLGPVNTIASAHVAMSTPNFVSLEILVDDVPWRDAMLREPLNVEGGTLVLSDAPGLGIELDLATCRAHPPTSSKYPSFRQADGAVAEW